MDNEQVLRTFMVRRREDMAFSGLLPGVGLRDPDILRLLADRVVQSNCVQALVAIGRHRRIFLKTRYLVSVICVTVVHLKYQYQINDATAAMEHTRLGDGPREGTSPQGRPSFNVPQANITEAQVRSPTAYRTHIRF